VADARQSRIGVPDLSHWTTTPGRSATDEDVDCIVTFDGDFGTPGRVRAFDVLDGP
jgi:hypothetical protein